MKKKNKDDATMGILDHLRKNIPEQPMAAEEEELEFPEEEEEDELPLLMKRKPSKIY